MKKILCVTLLAALTACSGNPRSPAPGVKVGKPYTVDGQTYYPEYDPHYDKTGTASWYGPGFHGKATATGEQYDQHALTAAHPTLPMPSMVRVTNLENGKSAVIRVNDRGPFKNNRLIDLSKASAEALDVTGLAKVRVQFLKDETEQYWANMNLKTNDIQFAKNDPYAPKDEDGPGKYDGTVVAKDDVAPQVKSAAPITSVASVDIKPEDLKVRPIRPRFSVVGEAEAAEIKDKNTVKVVQLVDGSGKPVGMTAKTTQPDNNEKIEVTDKTPMPQKAMAAAKPSSEDTDEAAPVGAEAKGAIDTSSEGGASTADAGDEAPATPFKKADPAKKAAEAAPASGGGWYVQAGSFSSDANAGKLAKQLKPLGGVDTRTVEVKGKNGTVYASGRSQAVK